MKHLKRIVIPMISIDYLAYGFKRLFHKPFLEVIHFGYYNSKLIPIHVYNRLILKKKNYLFMSDSDFVKGKLNINLDIGSNIYTLVSQLLALKDKNLFFFNTDNYRLKKDYLSNYAEQVEETIENANKYLNHEFSFLGRQFKFDDKVNYHYGFGQSPPSNQYFSDINYFIPSWDVKITWELNRQQHLPILAKAYFITSDEKYAKEVCKQIEQWIEQNPYLLGVNWVEGIEASIRMYSWIFAYNYIRNSKSLTPEINLKILKHIYLHGKFIKTFLSDKWIINGNHLLAELSGLLLIGITFPEFKESKEWVSFALKKLESEISTQIFDDGAIWEHSTGYHKFVTEMILYPVILLKKNGYKIPEIILRKLEKMLHFLDSIAMSNGKIPLIGDEDQGFFLKLNSSEYDDVRDILACGNILLNQEKLNNKSELAFWLFNGLVTISNKNENAQKDLKVFKDSGYCLFKSPEDYLLLTTSSQHTKYLHAAHRHLDLLSFVFECKGEYFIVDNGTYIYNGDKENRDLFRSLWMHNTLFIDEKNPCVLGPFEMQPRPCARILNYGKTNSGFYVNVCSAAYYPLLHNRSIIQTADGYIVYDNLMSNSSHLYNSYIHLHPHLEINIIDRYNVELIKNSVKIYIHSLNEINVIESKFSSKYGVYTNSKSLRIKVQSNNYTNLVKISQTNSQITESEISIIRLINTRK